MPKRFSGEVRLTVSQRLGTVDEYDIRVKAPGCSRHEGVSALQDGYTSVNGADAAMDEAALQYLRFMGIEFPALVNQAAKDGDAFHVGRSKSERWPGGTADTKTKKGR
jgi:hypothetical protein